MAANAEAVRLRVGNMDLEARKIGRFERLLGPEFYRILVGIVTNPLSIVGVILITLFVVVALAAPVNCAPR